MRATQNLVASTQPAYYPTPASCPSLQEMWACVEGERSHEEVSRVIQHCSSCALCAERWRTVCEQSVDGEKPELSPQPSVAVEASGASMHQAAASFDQPGGQEAAAAPNGNFDDMAHRFEDESFARPSLVPWAIGVGIVLVGIFVLMAI